MSSRSGSHPAGSRIARRRGDSQASNNGKKEKASFISVAVRVRPRLSREGEGTDVVEVLPDGRSLVLTDGNQRRQYTVDRVFDSRRDEGPQEHLFNDFGRGLVTESINGYNVCIFAYGHTGSGKTYTMLGSGGNIGEQAGMLPRFLHEIFRLHSEESAVKNWGYTCEFYEVYNEQVKDLLAPDKTDRQPKVHVHPRHGVRVENLTTSIVGSAKETLGLVNFGNQMRTVAATTMNERSSRSHAIFTFRFEQLEGSVASSASSTSSGGLFQSTVMFADLAGREDKLASQNKAVQFREMCFINTSLFHLAHLITKLSDGSVDKNSWTDFRNSKLTLLLSHALVGNSRTALIATLTPLQCFYEDTVSTMNFASSVKKIRTRPTINNKSPKVMISELEAEVRRLNKELSESTTSNAEKESELSTAQALIDHYKVSWEEAKAKSESTKKRRQTVIQAAGLLDLMDVRSLSLPLLPSGDAYPFFTKLSDDPSLQGCCNYFLCKKSMRVGSDEVCCDIRLQGVGIVDAMCDVKCDEYGNVEVQLLEADDDFSVPRVLVRGTPLLPDTLPCVQMKHGDSIILGYAHAFRLVAVTKEMTEVEGRDEMDARDLARSTLNDMDMASALSEIEEASALRNVAQYIANLSMRMPDHEVEEIQQAIRCICPLVDEANVITHEVCGADGVHFELRALTGIFDTEPPDLVVCVLQRLQRLGEAIRMPSRGGLTPKKTRSYTTGDMQELEVKHQIWKAWNPVAQSMGLSEHMKIGGEMALLYVWPLEKFFWRLGEIRDIYQEGSEAGDNFTGVRMRLSKKPHLNPWREVTVDENKLPLEERVPNESKRRFSAPTDLLEISGSFALPRKPSEAEEFAVPSKMKDNESGVKSAVVFAVQGERTTTLANHPGQRCRESVAPERSVGPAGELRRSHSGLTGDLRAITDIHDVAQFSLQDQKSAASAAPSPECESAPFREARRLSDSISQQYSCALPRTKWDAPTSSDDHEDHGSTAIPAKPSNVFNLSHQTVPSFSADAAGEGRPNNFQRQDSKGSDVMDPDPLTRAALWLEKTDQRASAVASTPALSASQRTNKSESIASVAVSTPVLPALQLQDVSSNVIASSTPSLAAVPTVPLQDVHEARRRRTNSSLSRLERRRPSVSSAGGMGGGDESPRLAQSLHEMWGKIDGFCQELRQRDEQVSQLTDERDRISGLLQTLLNRFQPAQEHAAIEATHQGQDQLRGIAEGLQSLIERVDRLELSSHNVRVCLSPGRSASIRPPGPPRSGHSSPRSFIAPSARGFAWPVGGPVASPRDARAEGVTSLPFARVPLVAVATTSPPSSRPRTPATPSAPAGVFQAVVRSPRNAQARHHSPLARSSHQSTPSWSSQPSARNGNAAVTATVARPRPISPGRSPTHSNSWTSGSSTAPVPLCNGSFTGPVGGSAAPHPISQASSSAASTADCAPTSGDRRAVPSIPVIKAPLRTQASSIAASSVDGATGGGDRRSVPAVQMVAVPAVQMVTADGRCAQASSAVPPERANPSDGVGQSRFTTGTSLRYKMAESDSI